ncbi:Os01g0104100, partial [Oryza sativa Japonica Group]
IPSHPLADTESLLSLSAPRFSPPPAPSFSSPPTYVNNPPTIDTTNPIMSSLCPFAKLASAGATCPVKSSSDNKTTINHTDDDDDDNEKTGNANTDPRVVPPKCPFGYDSNTFKLGPLSCMVCHALLHQSSKCTPCSHKFCKACILRFKDCPLCGADIQGIEPDDELQGLVDRFIDGHARIKRSHAAGDGEAASDNKTKVIYEDVSMERGAFLVQQAMRAFRAQNIESAKSRLSMCAQDIREELKSKQDNQELCSQLGAVLGMLGDCCRTLGDAPSAITYYEESAEFLSKLPKKDLELVHTLSVSLNKIGDLRYYDGDLHSARSYYARSLDVRRSAAKEHSAVASQVIDVATSLAKVADVDRNLGNESMAVEGFEEAIKCLENLKLESGEASLEQRRLSVLDFLQKQLDDK